MNVVKTEKLANELLKNEPFNDESKWSNENCGEYKAVSNNDPQAHAIVYRELVEDIDPSKCYLHHYH